MLTSFWLQFIQPERRLHIKATIEEMLAISAILYGGVASSGIIAISLPVWPEMDKLLVNIICVLGLLMALVFYNARKTSPLWLVVLHVPVGIILLSIVIYAGHAPQSAGIAVVYVVASTYTFHYFSRATAFFTTLFAMLSFSYSLYINDITGWPALVAFVTGCSVVLGEIVRITVSQLNFMAVRDNLTGLLNRTTIDAITNELLLNTQKTGESFTFMLLDLNKFKTVNDNEGHLRGDEVLKQVGLALNETITENGYAARWGGDEFIIILPDNNKDAINEIKKTLRNRLKDIISFEIGSSHAQKNDTLDSLVRRADEGMYQQKRNRRATDAAVA